MRQIEKMEPVKQNERISKQHFGNWIQNGMVRKRCNSFVDSLFEDPPNSDSVHSSATKVKSQADIIIKLWRDGFTVNDGELRTYTDAANKQFLESMKKGELPMELQTHFGKDELDVKFEDKKDEDHTLRKPVFCPFSGHGYRLGSAAPRIISAGENDPDEIDGVRRLPSVNIRDSEPVTSVQIWLADGRRIVQKFNITHRISHVREFIERIQRSGGRVPFTLTTSPPLHEPLDEKLTLEEARLQNAVLVQRLQKSQTLRTSDESQF
ncbi:UBX domain-containing protein 2A [Ambystoma mexicanum]|uniref:UBX domain-containing protein 2A n=1 Tax=Ambystoma mexicanum TaxID=8296 RepID=UPI0037E8C4C7